VKSAVDDAERRARMVMSKVAEPGDPDACRLVGDFSAREVIARLTSGGGLSSAKVAAWLERLAVTDPDAIAEAGHAVGARYLCPGDAQWPEALDDLARLEPVSPDRRGGAPFGLWVRGEGSLSSLTRSCVAIVGARASTAYGEHVAGGLAYGAAGRGFTVVSGGAYGIDAAAHRSVLERPAPTMAVLAGGIDTLYPVGNARLLERICEDGLLISEASPGITPTKSRFLVRNRLIAALSQGTVVVEAALRSGALNTARWAFDLNRPVMGVPGPITSMASGGVHELLRQPGTLLVTDANEVIEHISPAGEGLAPRKLGIVRRTDELTLHSRQVLDATPILKPAEPEVIARSAGVTREEAVTHLRILHDAGLVVASERGWVLARP